MAQGIDGIVDRLFPAYFVFGTAPDGMVDVADGDGDVCNNIAPDQAERLISDRERMRGVLTRALEALPSAEDVYRVVEG